MNAQFPFSIEHLNYAVAPPQLRLGSSLPDEFDGLPRTRGRRGLVL